MRLTKKGYKERLVDKKIEDYLSVFGAVSIEGPKWCGKTWSSLSHSNSVTYLEDEDIKEKANISVKLIFEEDKPQLIDKWNLFPEVWDAVRRKCDETTQKGQYILTCSTKITNNIQKEKIHHSGAGRIGKIQMGTMSLFEIGESSGEVSINNMKNGIFNTVLTKKVDFERLAYFIIRGGWPSNISVSESKADIIPLSYIEAILDKDIQDDKSRDKSKMKRLLKSLARNESSLASKATLLNDIEECKIE